MRKIFSSILVGAKLPVMQSGVGVLTAEQFTSGSRIVLNQPAICTTRFSQKLIGLFKESDIRTYLKLLMC